MARAQSKPELQRILFAEAKGCKWLASFREAGFLQPDHLPAPTAAKQPGYINIPHWPITEYLIGLIPEFSKPEHFDCSSAVLDFIRSTSSYGRSHGISNHRVWLPFAKMVAALPVELVNEKDLENIDFWLDDKYDRGLTAEVLGEAWLPLLLEKEDENARKLAFGVVAALYKTRIIDVQHRDETTSKKILFRFDTWYAKKAVAKVARQFGARFGFPAVELFEHRLAHALDELRNDNWSAIWRPAIEDHAQNHSADDPDDVLLEAYRDAFIGCIDSLNENALGFVLATLESKRETLERVAIYVIDQKFAQLTLAAEQFAQTKFFSANFQHELWHLLRNHFQSMSEQTQGKILGIIRSMTLPLEDGKTSIKGSAYKRSIWLSAIEHFGGEARRMYELAIAESGIEPQHPDFSSYMTSGWVTHKSPISKEQLSELDVPHLALRLAQYVDSGSWDEPSMEGLASTLRDVVKSNPLRYAAELEQFADLDFAYIEEILRAFNDIWSAKAAIPWDDVWPSLLSFCEKISTQERLWQPEASAQRGAFLGNGRWIVASIARLIEGATTSDEHSIDFSLVPRAAALIRTLLAREQGADFNRSSDPVTVAINSSRGICLSALITLALLSCRVARKTKESMTTAWEMYVRDFDREMLLTNKGVYEFIPFYLIHLANFLFMSKEWTDAQFDKVFDQDNQTKWLLAMQSFAHVNASYEPLYLRLKLGGDFARALAEQALEKEARNRIIQYIALAYIYGKERLNEDGSLIELLLTRRDEEELSQLIWFFWSLRDSKDVPVQAAALVLWPRLLAIIDPNAESGQRLLAQLSDWAEFIIVVDPQNAALLSAVAPFAAEGSHAWGLLRAIARISRQQPEQAYELWQTMLNHYQPDYPEDVILELFRNILNSRPGGVQRAKKIASQYVKAGSQQIFLAMQGLIESANPSP